MTMLLLDTGLVGIAAKVRSRARLSSNKDSTALLKIQKASQPS